MANPPVTSEGSSSMNAIPRERQEGSSCDKLEAETNHRLNEKLKTIKLTDLVRKVDTFASGSWGVLHLVQITGEPSRSFALKECKKSETKPRHFLAEKQILSSIDCDFILKLHATFEDDHNLYFLLDFYQGGELYKLCPVDDEEAAKFYTACSVEALDYLHAQNIIHGDFKPENLVLDHRGYLRLVDFGLSKQLESADGQCFKRDGTTEYFAPEMVLLVRCRTGAYGLAVDLWALGVVIYELFTGNNPFQVKDKNVVFDRILGGIPSFPSEITNEARDLIGKLCEFEPTQRLGYKGQFDQIRKHRWFQNFDWESLRKKTLPAPLVPHLESLTDTGHFKNDYSSSDEEDQIMDQPGTSKPRSQDPSLPHIVGDDED